MTTDPEFFYLQHEYSARGFDGISHEMSVMSRSDSWRLMQGAEPSHWLSYGTVPDILMRYGPYT